MHPLWLSIFLSLLICFTSVSMSLNSVAHDGAATDDTSDCYSVPYPFGAPGVALKGFEVVCTSTTTANRTKSYMPSINSTQLQNPSLKLPTGTYLIQNISLQGQVRILTGPIYQQCNDSGTEALTRGTGWLNLTGTPFTLSTNDTTLVVIGCDAVVTIEGVAGDSNGGGKNFKSGGCVAFCSNSSSRIDGSCSGLGCCQMPLPGPGGLKSFELNLYKVQNTGINQLTNCSAAFFTTNDKFSFRTAYFDDKEYFSNSQAERVAVLNWAIGNNSCEEAKNDVNSFACKENSLCYDSPNGVGYFCNCSQGYEGNPYVQGGCSDVDECQYPEINPCIGDCFNTEGSVTCDCPSGRIGDGKKDGSGCSRIPHYTDIFRVVLFLLIIVPLVISCCCSFWAWCLQKRKIVKTRTQFFRQNGGPLLQQRLASEGYQLAWDCRLRISAEAAGALAYLHSATSFPIIHRDIKSSNILLDKNFTAKVSDFGASRFVPFDKTHVTTLVQGTFGYLDPEYFRTSQLTEKSDVYSFGVVLAELLTGEKPISFARPEEFHNLAMYFTVAFDEGRLLQVIDPPVASEAGAEELYVIARLTRQCLSTKGEERPVMKEVALELEALRRRINQQNQRGNEEIQQLFVVGNPSSSEIVECTKQYSLEGHMLSSMDLPR